MKFQAAAIRGQLLKIFSGAGYATRAEENEVGPY